MKLQPIKNTARLRYQPNDKTGCFTVIRAIGSKRFKAGVSVVFEVSCDCGHITQRDRQSLIKSPDSCEECSFVGTAPKGATKHPLHKRWQAMIDRCTNPNNSSYKGYGGRGISVCHSWTKGDGELTGFECFLRDMGSPPRKGDTLERPNNHLGYGPDNCAWESRKIQSRNRRGLNLIEYDGVTMPVSVWAEKYDIPYFTLMRRLKLGWLPERAFNEPVKLGRRKSV